MEPLRVSGDQFILDGKPSPIVAGAIHYFRVVPEYWEDRLLRLKACGCNTLETYVSWNLHEPTPGEFNFEGICDIEQYIEIAGKIGLAVIVRPGPYICSEWDLGALPAWLLADPGMRLRCAYQPYLDAMDCWFDEFIPRMARLQASEGGPVIAMQIENEYGSFGNDKVYLRHIRDGLRQRGFNDFLFTSDGANYAMLQGGTLPEEFAVVNFGSDAEGQFNNLRKLRPTGPLMCGEFWNGWFNHWGEEHKLREPQEAAQVLDDMLRLGGSVNFYMFHGGTNFGFNNGANHFGNYEPTITSYDFDAPVSECGDLTPKYWAYRDVITKYLGAPEIEPPADLLKKSYGTVLMTQRVGLFEALGSLSEPVSRPTPDCMEAVGQNFGFILYRTQIQGPREAMPLHLQYVADRALVWFDGEYRGSIWRNGGDEDIMIECEERTYQLDVLVENMGRVNYGAFLHDRKGITEGIRLGKEYGQFLFGWEIFPLPLDDLSGLSFSPMIETTGTAFYRATFEVDESADTFLELPGWDKGAAWINGFNLGRYWNPKGPQKTLYVPAPILKQGTNELIVFELHDAGEAKVEFRDQPDLG